MVDANAKGWNQNQTIPFELNFPTGSRNSVAQGIRSLQDTTSFWAHQIIFIYQDNAYNDADPGDEQVLMGGTVEFVSQKWTSISVEAIRESQLINLTSFDLRNQAQRFVRAKQYKNKMLGMIAHEIGHSPGGNNPNGDHAELGLMKDGGDVISTEYSPKTIDRFRKATHWSE